MVLNRVFVSGVIVATLDVQRLDLARLGELALVFEEARRLKARGVVLDFPEGGEVEPLAALALLELVAPAPLSAASVEEKVAKQSGCYRIPVMTEELVIAFSGLSASQCFALGDEPLLTDIVLAETWLDGVRVLSSRMPTMVPASSRRTA